MISRFRKPNSARIKETPMTTSKIFVNIVSLAASISLVASFSALPALAQTGAAGSATPGGVSGAAQTQRIQLIKTRAGEEIDRRITALNTLTTRIGYLKRVSDAVKSSISSTAQTQITELTALKAKIDADTDLATLRTDVKSITASYRIFVLVIPQGHLLAAADRINTIADSLTAIGGKLQTRISDAQSAGHDVSALQTALTDFNAKVADAKTQAAAAISAITGLTPDQGDKTKLQANQAALKNARALIKTATQDLDAARKDARTIMQGLKAFGATTGTPPAGATPPAGTPPAAQ